jgi:ferric-dicitrate binding protein FerR (iron transport regulator)
MILADSTLVYLNAGSELWYSPDSKDKKREVYLKGEAWFDVTKQKNRPFVVHTSFYDVNVTGTRFNVKAYETDNEITTTLEEGQVRITSSDKYNLAEPVILNPGEQVALNKELNEIFVKKVDTKLFTSWKDNKLMFLNMNFKELIVLLERKYGVDIEVDNPDILKYHYSGTLKNESILEILEIIKHTLPIQYKIEGQKVIINKIKRED